MVTILESRLVGEKSAVHKVANYTPELQCESIAYAVR
jgi:hypothetical protein